MCCDLVFVRKSYFPPQVVHQAKDEFQLIEVGIHGRLSAYKNKYYLRAKRVSQGVMSRAPSRRPTDISIAFVSNPVIFPVALVGPNIVIHRSWTCRAPHDHQFPSRQQFEA